MRDEHDLSAATDAAWTAFRGRLADHVAAMDDDEVLVVAYADVVDDDAEGAGPYVQLCAFGEGRVQVETASNHVLDDSVALTPEQEDALLLLGWEEPLDEPGWENFHLTADRRDADRVAVLLVQTLREVHGVPHPAFLDARGLEVDPELPPPTVAPVGLDDEDDDDDDGTEAGPVGVVRMPRDPEHLRSLVDDAMRVVFPDLKHDDDGDIPIRAGRSSLYVRVLDDRPVVELYAEIVLDVGDLERLPIELGVLNASHGLWKFVEVDGLVVMRHELLALPFSAFLLRVLVQRFLDEVDQLAGDLVARVGGRRFLDRAPAPAIDAAVDEVGDDDLVMAGLLELCHLGRPRAATVAGLFEHDRHEIIRQIVRVRTGRQTCGDHDPDLVLTALRKALRLRRRGRPPGAPAAEAALRAALVAGRHRPRRGVARPRLAGLIGGEPTRSVTAPMHGRNVSGVR